MLDTGVYPESTLSSEALDAHQLITDPGIIGWKGPYLSYEKNGSLGLEHPVLGTLYITRVKKDTWPAYNPAGVSCPNNHIGNCSVFVKIQVTTDLAMLQSFEKRIDGTSSPSSTSDLSGSFRYSFSSGTGSGWFEGISYDKSQGVN